MTAIPKYPSARPRSAGSNSSKIIAIATGIRRPPPTPWRTRATTSSGRVGAIAHSIDANVNSTSAVMNARRRPKRSPTQPLVNWVTPTAMRYAVTTHSTPCNVPKSRWSEASARFTIVVSSTTMNTPNRTTPIATQRYGMPDSLPADGSDGWSTRASVSLTDAPRTSVPANSGR